jgi:hypothetical protein
MVWLSDGGALAARRMGACGDCTYCQESVVFSKQQYYRSGNHAVMQVVLQAFVLLCFPSCYVSACKPCKLVGNGL